MMAALGRRDTLPGISKAYDYDDKQARRGQEADIPQVAQPGLKTHICTLVAPDSPPGQWLETYIHAKLMIVNDAFTTIGSANTNTRSMEVDSEMNVLLDRPEVAKPLRQKLWGMHTDGRSGGTI